MAEGRAGNGAAPSPYQLWVQAGGETDHYDQAEYLRPMRVHGHLLYPGDDGYEQGSRNLPCGWPHRSERPPLTEAQYAAAVDERMREHAEELTALLPQEIRDAGMRIEWTTTENRSDDSRT